MGIIPGMCSDDITDPKKESETLAKVLKNLEKYGGVIKSGSQILSKKRKIIPFSPNLDMYLGGGIPEGCFVVISGHPKIGKTTSILSFCAQAQKLGKHIYYFDVEHRLKEMNLGGIEGLLIDEDHFTVVQSTEEKTLTAEDFLTIAEEVVKDHPGCVVIFDSASGLCAAKEYVDPISGQTRSLGPKLLSSFCKRISAPLNVNNTILIMVQHLITNTSGYGELFSEDGGVKIKYAMDIKMRAKKREMLLSGSGDGAKNVGIRVFWDIICTALGMPPVDKVESCIRFGKGIDRAYEIMDTSLSLGFIKSKGAWFTLGEQKFQGKENLYQYLVSEYGKEDLESLDKSIKELLNPKIKEEICELKT